MTELFVRLFPINLEMIIPKNVPLLVKLWTGEFAVAKIVDDEWYPVGVESYDDDRSGTILSAEVVAWGMFNEVE